MEFLDRLDELARLRPEARDRVFVADISAEVSRPLAPWPVVRNVILSR